ncbi:MAG: amino acid adenylation domain-containing protein [Pseudomonadota bacterium]
MSSASSLHQLLDNSARRYPNNIAIEDPSRPEIGAVTYSELEQRANEVREELERVGVQPGDRVGIYAPKSIGSLISVFGILKAGAAYVPVDPGAPPQRNAYIFKDCSVRVVVAARQLQDGLRDGFAVDSLPVLKELETLEQYGVDLLLSAGSQDEADSKQTHAPTDRLSYILYTSGSTGMPKGVMHTHDSALSFIDWCSETFELSELDRFSAHAPFHFDLSILDIYAPIKHGARVVLVGEDLGKQPRQLASVIAELGITVWYSTPSILRLLVEYGQLQQHDYSALRIVFFAGEVYPVKHLRAVKAIWPQPRYYNLYGPTETNVCTYYEVPDNIPEERTEPFPIGKACSGDETIVVDEHGRAVKQDQEGELYVRGGSVMLGYWNLPDRNSHAFFADESGKAWYKTGDIVKEDHEGNYIYIGRRDRMIKRRGYRVELGEIESVLYRHPDIAEAAAIALPDQESGVLVKVFLNWSGEKSPSLIELKGFCAGNLPNYMIPDRFSVLPALPKTSTDKIDYQKLKELD